MATRLSPALNGDLEGRSCFLFLLIPPAEGTGAGTWEEPTKACYLFAVGTGKARQGHLVHSPAPALTIWESACSNLTHSLHRLLPSRWALLADQVLCALVGICHFHAGPTGNVPTVLNSKQFWMQPHTIQAGHQGRLWSLVTAATEPLLLQQCFIRWGSASTAVLLRVRGTGGTGCSWGTTVGWIYGLKCRHFLERRRNIPCCLGVLQNSLIGMKKQKNQPFPLH